MIVDVDVRVPCAAWRKALPAAEAMCTRAVRAAVSGTGRIDRTAVVEVSLLLADALALNHEINGLYLATVSAYSALYTTAVLCLAAALFQTCETG